MFTGAVSAANWTVNPEDSIQSVINKCTLKTQKRQVEKYKLNYTSKKVLNEYIPRIMFKNRLEN